MATIQERIQGILSKPIVRKIGGALLADALPKLRARIGEDPAVALGGLATFLAWVAGKLPAKIAKPIQGAVMLAGLFGIKAAVTPAAAPKIVVKAPVQGVPAPVKVSVPLVVPPAEHVRSAIEDAVAKATSGLGGILGGVAHKVVPGGPR
jgi:hypothetical protein